MKMNEIISPRIKIGVIGIGHWGPNLARNFNSLPESELVCLCDLSKDKLNAFSVKYPNVSFVHSANEVINNPDIDAVVICTPTNTHYKLCKQALLANKHVFVEKPLTTDVNESQELTSLAYQMDRVLFVGHVFLHNNSIKEVKKLIDDTFSFGRIYSINITRTNLGPIRNDVSALWDLVPHDLSILQYWFDQKPISVSAVGGKFINNRLEDTIFATYKYANNMIVNIHASWLSPRKTREIVIVGEHKMLVWNDMDLQQPITIYNKCVALDVMDNTNTQAADTFMGFRTNIHNGDTIIPRIMLNEPLLDECRAFLDAIQGKENRNHGSFSTDIVDVLSKTDASLGNGGNVVAIN